MLQKSTCQVKNKSKKMATLDLVFVNEQDYFLLNGCDDCSTGEGLTLLVDYQDWLLNPERFWCNRQRCTIEPMAVGQSHRRDFSSFAK